MTSNAALVLERSGKADLPPMLSQYLRYKDAHPECLILFQVGDFYEIFFDDAVVVAQTLNLTLTSRDKSAESPIPMCGVPVGAVDGYIERLVDQGHAVAVVSQVNQSSLSRLPTAFKEENSSGKITIQRELARIVTPGMRLLSAQATSGLAQIIASVVPGRLNTFAIASSDPQSGVVELVECSSFEHCHQEIARLQPCELILPQESQGRPVDRRSSWVRSLERHVRGQALRFRPMREGVVRDEVSTLSGYRAASPLSRNAVALLVSFVDEATVHATVRFFEIRSAQDGECLRIPASTRANLELFEPSSGSQTTSTVFHVIDKTVSPGGRRLLAQWLSRPLCNPAKIHRRHDAVDFLRKDHAARESLHSLLSIVPDLERIAARLELGSVSPRELAAARNCLTHLERVACLAEGSLPSLLRELLAALSPNADLLAHLQNALAEEPPLSTQDGGVIRDGFNAELDAVRDVQRDGRAWVQTLEKREQESTGIPTLKIKFNYVLGFFIEVTKSHASRVPSHYQRRQGTTSAERFITDELKQKESSVLGADEKALALERQLFEQLRKDLEPHSHHLRSLGVVLSTLDVLATFAKLADQESWVRPVVNDGTDLVIEQGRHPVVAHILQGGFVANSLQLGGGKARCAIVTGPNMGGKSTYLRQAGLITILAQMGSFVPCERAEIGVVDQVFARIGASDNIAGGESTFMVEMREAAEILSQASERSLLLIDELGRGTATRDGVALAQAILEHLVEKLDCRMLFATHFHELTRLEQSALAVANFSVAAVEHGGEVVFTHEIRIGPANQSYGLEVARLAGLPSAVLQRSEALLQQQPSQPSAAQLSLFPVAKQTTQAVVLPSDYEELKALRSRVREIDVDGITPLQALQLLAELKQER